MDGNNKGDLRFSMIFIGFSLAMIFVHHPTETSSFESSVEIRWIFQLASCKLGLVFFRRRVAIAFNNFLKSKTRWPFETCETCSRQMDSRNLNLFRTFLFLANFHETTWNAAPNTKRREMTSSLFGETWGSFQSLRIFQTKWALKSSGKFMAFSLFHNGFGWWF